MYLELVEEIDSNTCQQGSWQTTKHKHTSLEAGGLYYNTLGRHHEWLRILLSQNCNVSIMFEVIESP